MAEDMILQAIKRAYEERGVKVQIVPEHQLLGVSKEEAMKAVKANRWFTSEQGYMEVRAWILQRFGDAEVPKKWLKERRPDLYKAVFQREEDSCAGTHRSRPPLRRQERRRMRSSNISISTKK